MQHSFYLDKRSIRISVTHGGKQYRRATGLLVSDASLWDQGTASIKAKCKDKRVLHDVLTIHSRLTEREVSARTHADVISAIDYALDWAGQRTEKQMMKGGEMTAKPRVPTFWEYFDAWGKRESPAQRQRALAVRVVARLMGRKEDWDGIDSSYWFRLQQKMKDEGYSPNYRWNIGARLKTAMHEGYKLKYHHNDDFREFSARKEQTEAIALSAEEIESLWTYEPSSAMYGKCRDLALIGYYSAARFSDYSRLTMDNIRDGRLVFVQKKTDDKVVIPASPRLILLLERNGGHAPDVCQVVFNRYIKRIAKDAGIDGVVELPKSRRKKDGSPTYRWEMVQSHTFRRSAITALYLSGVPIRDCMFVSGHKSLQTFENYLRIQKDEAVERLEKSEFFK